jgi:protein-S-isoprenylcysteine O-methyltransferase Ste14
MPFWGVGPVIGVTTAGYALAAVTATLVWPSAFSIAGLPHKYLAVAGGMLLAVGVIWYVVALRAIVRAYRAERLVTDGMYALCRHPVYAAWVWLILPGLGLLMDSWLLLSAAVVMYVVTKICIRREEASLEAQFGDRYLEYRRRTNALFPTLPRRR